MEKLAELTLITQRLPSPTEEYEESEDQSIPGPDSQGKYITTWVMVTMTRPKDAVLVKMGTDIYMFHYDV